MALDSKVPCYVKKNKITITLPVFSHKERSHFLPASIATKPMGFSLSNLERDERPLRFILKERTFIWRGEVYVLQCRNQQLGVQVLPDEAFF